jgi:hypothetical protein
MGDQITSIPMKPSTLDYASLFAELFCCNLASIHTVEFLASKRTANRRKCECDFGEEHLQKLIADSALRKLPPGCPALSVDTQHAGRVDYKFFSDQDRGTVVASCQMKGPLRKKGEKDVDNHFGDILEDIAKQRREVARSKNIEHYVGILFCLDKDRAERSLAKVWLPALQAETTAVLSKAAIQSTRLGNHHTATVCIVRVKLRTHYECGCYVR